MRPLVIAALAMAPLAGCPAPPTSFARAAQVAQEFNQDARFNRSELMMEHVAPELRDDFAARHRAWGTAVRLADLEVAGVRAHGDHELRVTVRVAWYRPEEEELRVTLLEQSWRDGGGWQLEQEKRIEGDVGLLGEVIVYQTPDMPRQPARFPTVRLGGETRPWPGAAGSAGN
jgi:hypothetical protein